MDDSYLASERPNEAVDSSFNIWRVVLEVHVYACGMISPLTCANKKTQTNTFKTSSLWLTLARCIRLRKRATAFSFSNRKQECQGIFFSTRIFRHPMQSDRCSRLRANRIAAGGVNHRYGYISMGPTHSWQVTRTHSQPPNNSTFN